MQEILCLYYEERLVWPKTVTSDDKIHLGYPMVLKDRHVSSRGAETIIIQTNMYRIE